jgi:hypothetical protein
MKVNDRCDGYERENNYLKEIIAKLSFKRK